MNFVFLLMEKVQYKGRKKVKLNRSLFKEDLYEITKLANKKLINKMVAKYSLKNCFYFKSFLNKFQSILLNCNGNRLKD